MTAQEWFPYGWRMLPVSALRDLLRPFGTPFRTRLTRRELVAVIEQLEAREQARDARQTEEPAA